jgi:hypothetical protein
MGNGSARRLALTALIGSVFLLVLVVAPSAEAYVYYGSFGTIGRAENDGSSPEPNFIDLGAGPFVCGIAVDAGHIYWGDHNSQTIGRANIDGTQVEPKFITNAGEACGVAVDSTRIYWTSLNGLIGHANINGSGATTQASPGGSSACGIAVDAGGVYYNVHGGSGYAIYQADPATPAQPTGTIGVTPTGYCGLAVAAGRLYWTNGGPGSTSTGLWSVSTTAPFAPILLTETEQGVWSLAADGSHAYWGTYSGGTVNRVGIDGVTPPEKSILTGLHEAAGLAIDSLSHTLPPVVQPPAPVITPAPGGGSGGSPTVLAPAAPVLALQKVGDGKAQFTLSSAGSVRLVFEASRRGHKVHGKCRPGKAKKGACTYFKVVATRTVSGAAGLNTVKLPQLAKGHYKVTITPSGGKPVTTSFTVQ